MKVVIVYQFFWLEMLGWCVLEEKKSFVEIQVEELKGFRGEGSNYI